MVGTVRLPRRIRRTVRPRETTDIDGARVTPVTGDRALPERDFAISSSV